MGGLPEDLIVFLLFAAFVLVQILRNWRRGKRRRPQADPVATGPVEIDSLQAEPEPVAATPEPQPWVPTLAEGPRPRPLAASVAAHAPAGSPSQRFSRSRLLGDRHALHDAIVVATILGPCRARRPHEME
jgi:hypothetical protein